MRALFRAGFWALLAVLAAAPPVAAEMMALSGQVTYRERVALPAGATLRIVLVDLTEADQPVRVDVQAPIGSPGQVPLTFALNFDNRALEADHQHGLIAEILSGDHIWFTTPEAFRLDPAAPPSPLVVMTTPATADAPDAASATDVASASSALMGVTWRAAVIRGAPTAAGIDSTLSISADRRVGGGGGCNSYFTQAEIAGASISVGAIAATRMTCLTSEANAQESAFFDAIGATRSWQLADDGSLVFLDAGNEVVVRFEPVTR